MTLLVFLLDLGTDKTVWHYCFSMGLLNCSDSVPLFVLLLDFGTVPRVWHYWFFIFLFDFGTVPTVWHYFFDMGF